jgi:hypothetical protein
MCLQLMSLQVHLVFENDELLLQAFLVWAEEVIFSEMNFQRIVIDIVLLRPSTIASIADMTSLVLIPAVCIELVVSIESLATKAAFRMTLESSLIFRARIVVAKSLVLPQAVLSEQFVLVGEDFLVPRAEVTHHSVMYAPDMSMKVRPSETSHVTALVGAVVSK